ncbi:hypothetical protein D5S17_15825 [Pseudonocardiaceae bacterium YIM PH 21723]|nr:hypothetical protein D5S17_15825 [Pseudonocardiaceae bacterium YIM PH 21723]
MGGADRLHQLLIWEWNVFRHALPIATLTALLLAAAPVALADPGETYQVAGVVYGDKNDNGSVDPGEAIAGATVSTILPSDMHPRSAQTGEDGRFDLGELPAKKITVTVDNVPEGWATASFPVQVDERAGQLQLRLAPPPAATLTVAGVFDRDEYEPGETARLSWTLRNTGDKPLSRITARCYRGGNGLDEVTTEQWGDLVSADGVGLAPGQARTFQVHSEVPAETVDYGVVRAECTFAQAGQSTGPRVRLLAHVASGTGDKEFQLFEDRNGNQRPDDGEYRAGIAASLVDQVDQRVIATAVSDADGRMTFTDQPFGVYALRFDGPWTWAGTGPELKIGTGSCESYCARKAGPFQVKPAAPKGVLSGATALWQVYSRGITGAAHRR